MLGGAAIERLLSQRPDRELTVLVRRPDQAARLTRPGVHCVLGDLTLPQLGIDPHQYRQLTETVTQIIHGAADVRFDLSLAASRAVNFAGTRSMLELARSCRRLEKMVHVSTVYVNGYRQGTFAEGPIPPGQKFVNTYQQAKHEAELLVGEAMKSLPIAVYRLSLVIADSAAGSVSQFNYFHHLLRSLPGSALPMVPGDPEVGADLITNDWAAATLAYLFDERFQTGTYRHLCAGPEAALPLADVIARCCGVVEAHSSNETREPVRVPRLVSLSEYNRFLESCTDPHLRRVAEALGTHVRLMGVRQSHLNAGTLADLQGSGIALGDAGQYIENTIRYCLDTNWGERLPEEAVRRHC